MHLRRALLLFALVLGVTAIAASLVPPPTDDEPRPDRPTPATSPEASNEELRIGFRFPPERDRPVTRRVEPGRPLVVAVSATQPGQVAIPALGRIASLTPQDPARIDLLLTDAGSYEVEFTPTVGGESRRLGKIVARSR